MYKNTIGYQLFTKNVKIMSKSSFFNNPKKIIEFLTRFCDI